MAESKHIPKVWKEEIIKKQHGYCASPNCAKLHHGKKMKVDMYANFDHKTPLAMNGKNIKSNIQALCPGCHAEKTRKDHERIKKWKEKHPDDPWKINYEPVKFKKPKF